MNAPPPWLDTQYITLTAGSSWTMPQSWWRGGERHQAAYVLLTIDAFTTSGGTLDAVLQSSPMQTIEDNGWLDCASSTAIAATGPKVLIVTRTATNAVMGPLRLKFTANTATVTFTVRAELMLKNPVVAQALDWLDDRFISFSEAATVYLQADQWVDVSKFLDAFCLVEWGGISGTASNLTVKLQTAPAMSIDNDAWADVATATMGNGLAVLDGRSSKTSPPMGVLRLAFTASAALSGTLRVGLLLKDT